MCLMVMVSFGVFLKPAFSETTSNEPVFSHQQQRDMLDSEYFRPPYTQHVISSLVSPLQVIRQGKHIPPLIQSCMFRTGNDQCIELIGVLQSLEDVGAIHKPEFTMLFIVHTLLT